MHPHCNLAHGLLTLACFSGLASLSAQTTIRGWGIKQFDTEVLAAPAAWVGAKSEFTAVLRTDGRLFVRGRNLGSCEVPTLPPGVRVVAASVDNMALALLDTGDLMQWGGLTGTLPATDPARPWIQVASGDAHALALRADGTIATWMATIRPDIYGLLAVPLLPAGLRYTKIKAGTLLSGALVSDGSARIWGTNTYGQCNVPPLPTGLTYTAVAPGQWHSLALRSDGTLTAFGDNSMGQCNVAPLPQGVVYTDVMASWHSLALRSDGTAVAWGLNNYGQCNVPPLPPGMQYTQIAAGELYSLALRSDGQVIAWGYDLNFSQDLPTPTPNHNWRKCAVGSAHGIALDSAGTIHHFGARAYGLDQVPTLPPGVTYVDCAASIFHSVALCSDGTVRAWGDNISGQLNVPPLPAGLTYTKIACSHHHTVLLRSDGQALPFGNLRSGSGNLPALPTGMRYVDVAAGSNFTLVHRSDGTLIGRGVTNDLRRNVPTAPPGVRFTQISVADYFAAALRSDGEFVIWGSGVFNIPPLPFGVYYVDAICGSHTISLRRSDGTADAYTEFYAGIRSNPPPLAPGTSYRSITGAFQMAAGITAPASSYITFASGCSGSQPPTRLIPADTPKLGETLLVRLDRLPNDLAFLVFGWQRLPTPFPLTSLGMPGCTLQIAVDATAGLVGTGGWAEFELPIPYHASLLGQTFHHQALVPDAGAGNPLGAVVSDAAVARIGL